MIGEWPELPEEVVAEIRSLPRRTPLTEEQLEQCVARFFACLWEVWPGPHC